METQRSYRDRDGRCHSGHLREPVAKHSNRGVLFLCSVGSDIGGDVGKRALLWYRIRLAGLSNRFGRRYGFP